MIKIKLASIATITVIAIGAILTGVLLFAVPLTGGINVHAADDDDVLFTVRLEVDGQDEVQHIVAEDGEYIYVDWRISTAHIVNAIMTRVTFNHNVVEYDGFLIDYASFQPFVPAMQAPMWPMFVDMMGLQGAFNNWFADWRPVETTLNPTQINPNLSSIGLQAPRGATDLVAFDEFVFLTLRFRVLDDSVPSTEIGISTAWEGTRAVSIVPGTGINGQIDYRNPHLVDFHPLTIHFGEPEPPCTDATLSSLSVTMGEVTETFTTYTNPPLSQTINLTAPTDATSVAIAATATSNHANVVIPTTLDLTNFGANVNTFIVTVNAQDTTVAPRVYTINVTRPIVVSSVIMQSATSFTRRVTDTSPWDPSKKQFLVTYNNGNTEVITGDDSRVDVTNVPALTSPVVNHPVTVEFLGETFTVYITVQDYVASISLNPAVLTLFVGDSFADGSVQFTRTLAYGGAQVAQNVTSSMLTSGFDTATPTVNSSTRTVTVTYTCAVNGVQTATFELYVDRHPAPVGMINFTTERITGLVANGVFAVEGVVGTRTADAAGTIQIADLIPSSGNPARTITLVQVINGGNSYSQTIEIPVRPAAPTGITPHQPSIATTSDGRVTGVLSTMEYRVGTTENWNVGGAEVTGLAAGATVQVRFSATDSAFASEVTSVTIPSFILAPHPTPEAVIDFENELLTGLVVGAQYLVNAASRTAVDGTIEINVAGWFGSTVSIVRVGDGSAFLNSSPQSLAIPARPVAATLTATRPTSLTFADGEVTITHALPLTQLQYHTGNNVWVTVPTEGVITGLASGTVVSVRVTATTTNFAGAVATATIQPFINPHPTPEITVNHAQEQFAGWVSGASYRIEIGPVGAPVHTINSAASITNILEAWHGLEIRITRLGTYPTSADSATQFFTIPTRSTAPIGVGVTHPTTITAQGTITGVTDQMEWSTNLITWTTVPNGATSLAASVGTVHVRYRADSPYFASPHVTHTINAFNAPQWATPNIQIDFVNETLTGFTASASGVAYSINGTNITVFDGVIDIETSWFNASLSIIRLTDGETHLDSDAQTLSIPVHRRAAPNITMETPTGVANDDGALVGIEDTMEWRRVSPLAATPHDGSWQVGSGDLTGLSAGSVFEIRYRAIGGQFISNTATRTIPSFAATQEQTPTASQFTIDFINETLVFDTLHQYTINGGAPVSGMVEIENWFGTNVQIIRLGMADGSTFDSEPLSFPIPSRPAAPNVTTSTPATQANNTITGVSNTMEWRLAGTDDWTTVVDTSITGLNSGAVVEIRVAALAGVGGNFYGETSTVTIGTYIPTEDVTYRQLSTIRIYNDGALLHPFTGFGATDTFTLPSEIAYIYRNNISIVVTTTHNDATITAQPTNPLNLEIGLNTFTFTVRSPAGSYKDYTININLAADPGTQPVITSVVVHGDSERNFVQGVTFVTGWIQLVVNYDDGDSRIVDVPVGWITDHATVLYNLGTRYITITYPNFATPVEWEITVVAGAIIPDPEIVRIEFVSGRTEYEVGESFEQGSIRIRVVYDNDSYRFVYVDYTMLTGFDTSSITDGIAVTITYEGFTTTFTLVVVEEEYNNGGNGGDNGNQPPVIGLPALVAPQNLTISATDRLTWDEVSGATGYAVYINAIRMGTTTALYFDLTTLDIPHGTFVVSVRALGNNTTHADSSLSLGLFHFFTGSDPLGEDEQAWFMRHLQWIMLGFGVLLLIVILLLILLFTKRGAKEATIVATNVSATDPQPSYCSSKAAKEAIAEAFTSLNVARSARTMDAAKQAQSDIMKAANLVDEAVKDKKRKK